MQIICVYVIVTGLLPYILVKTDFLCRLERYSLHPLDAGASWMDTTQDTQVQDNTMCTQMMSS